MTDQELENLHDAGDGTHVTEELYLEAKRARAAELELLGQLQHVDAVLARRSALDDKHGRVAKILHAISVAGMMEPKKPEP